jgi:glutamyl-Q tRNA(Asp) synthetase
VPTAYGDVVLARKEMPASYHLCVVIDDAAQGVTHVTRGEDLFDATHIHRALQAVLALPVPTYCHHGLLKDNTGKRLAKRDGARSLASLRAAGYTPQDVRNSLNTALLNGGIWQV